MKAFLLKIDKCGKCELCKCSQTIRIQKKLKCMCYNIGERGRECGCQKKKKRRHFVKDLPRKIKVVPLLHQVSHFAKPHLQCFSCIYLNVHSTDISSLKRLFYNKHQQQLHDYIIKIQHPRNTYSLSNKFIQGLQPHNQIKS